MMKSRLNQFLRSLLPYAPPAALRVCISSRCQLQCPECTTASGENRSGVVGWGDMKVGDFSSILDHAPFVRSLEIAHTGEVFLNKDLPAILQVAFERGVAVTASVGVNLNTMTDEACEALVRFQVRKMTIAIDGASQDIYEKYRRGGSFDRVIDNIKRINACRNRAGSLYPRLSWQFVLFRHNIHQLKEARRLARSLGMDFIEKLDWSDSPAKDGKKVPRRDDYRKEKRRVYLLPCRQLWLSPQINWDGTLLGCCNNKAVGLGNVLRDGVEEVLRNARYVRLKKTALGLVEPKKADPCFHCSSYWQAPYHDRLRTLLSDLVSAGAIRMDVKC